MKKSGFTLTEALVTLIVLGLVTVASLNIVGVHIKATNGNGVNVATPPTVSPGDKEEAQEIVNEFDEDWTLLKKWFSIAKLKEVVAMEDNNENKVIKSNETLLDVINNILKRLAALEAQGNNDDEGGSWQAVCEGAACASYTGSFSFDYQYMFDISGDNSRAQFPAILIQNGNNAPFLVAEVQDAADYFIYQENGLKACHAWYTDGSAGNQRNTLKFNHKCDSNKLSINAVYKRKIK